MIFRLRVCFVWSVLTRGCFYKVGPSLGYRVGDNVDFLLLLDEKSTWRSLYCCGMKSGGSLYGFADSMEFNSIEVKDVCFIVLS